MNPSRIILILTLWLITRLSTFGQNATDPAYPQDSLILLGDSLFIFEDFTGAQAAYLQSLRKMEMQKDMAGSLYALTRLARTAIEMKDPEKALGYLKKADRIGREHAPLYLERGITLKEWAVFYDQSGQDSLAKSYFERSLELLESCCAKQPEILGEAYLDYAKLHAFKENEKSEDLVLRAIRYLQQCMGILDLRLAEAYNLYGGLVRERGETELRNTYVNTAEQILQKYPSSPFGLMIKINFEKVVRYIDEDRFPKAAVSLETIIDLLKSKYGPDWEDLNAYLLNLGSVYVEMKDSRAYDVLKDLEKRIVRSMPPDVRDLAGIHHTLGNFFVNEEAFDSAKFYFNAALQKLSPDSDSFSLSILYRDMAEMSLREGLPQKALDYSDLSLQFAGYWDQEVFEPSVLESRNIDLYFDPMELRGRILLDLFRENQDKEALDAALRIFGQIELIAEFTRNGSYTEETKQIVSEHFHRSAQGALTVLTALNQLSPEKEYVASAFNFMEHNRYARLFQDLNRSQAFRSTPSNDNFPQRFRFFVTEIERLELEISQAERQKQTYQEYADSLVRYKKDFQDFKEAVRKAHPGEYQIRYDNMLSLEAIQRKINRETQLFEFFWGDSNLSLITLTSDTAMLVSIPVSVVMSSLDRILPWLVSDYVPDSVSLSYPQFAILSHRLYQTLIGPWLRQSVKRLLISTDGPLTYLPFEILITDTASVRNNFSSAPYLLQNLEISYTLSSNIHFTQSTPGSLRNPKVLAMSYSMEADAHGISRQGYREIPYSATEIEAIRKRFRQADVTLLKGTEATKTTFLSLSPTFDLIHLAVHGLGDTVSGLSSHLIFKSSSDTDVGRLFAHELYNLPSPGWRLAVLSACETGVGKSYPGEGIFSIARGFAHAGTPSMVMSLWKANDQTTALMMEYFYHHLNQGITISEAMQLAKIDFLRQVDPEASIPYYWAGFVVMGNTTGVVSDSFRWYYFSLAVIILMVAYYLVRRGARTPEMRKYVRRR